MGVKITKDLLDEYRKSGPKIWAMEYELEQLKNTDAGIGNDVIMDYRDGYGIPQSVVGRDEEKIAKKEKVLKAEKKKWREVKQWIDSIEDVQTKNVFQMFYTKRMEWKDIAKKTGYSKHPDYPRKMYRDPYLEKCGIK